MTIYSVVINHNVTICMHWLPQIFQDWHLILMVLAITGITAFLLLLEVSIPPLRGYPILETDREQQTGETVKLIKALRGATACC